MAIEHELTDFLIKALKDGNNKLRDIEIILHFYGFKDDDWPTLEETAAHFGMNTRERVRQIIKKKFREVVDLNDIPTLERCNEILQAKDFWLEDDLKRELAQVTNNDSSIRGIFNLMDDLGMSHGFEIYTPDLKKASRNTIDRYEYNFVISNNILKTIRLLLKKALRSPSTYGISNFASLENKNSDFILHGDVIKKLISVTEHAWTKLYKGDFWFIFESRDNTLVNYSEKIFSVITQCDSDRLAQTYSKALIGRQSKNLLPPVDLIKQYLESSIYLENNNGELTFIGEKRSLNEIDLDIVDYLKENPEVSFPVFSKHLIDKGYGVPHVTKTLTSSPLIYVDKSKGRHHYVYSLIGSIKDVSNKSNEDRERYTAFLIRLRKISALGTDETVKQKRRREQGILQEWLFKGKTQECCALCGNTYSVKTLATAHKKKRSECNEAERLDPYIVMPVCYMGCDYLYEHKYIYVENGVIKRGVSLDAAAHEDYYIDILDGRELSEQWLKGSASYFEVSIERKREN